MTINKERHAQIETMTSMLKAFKTKMNEKCMELKKKWTKEPMVVVQKCSLQLGLEALHETMNKDSGYARELKHDIEVLEAGRVVMEKYAFISSTCENVYFEEVNGDSQYESDEATKAVTAKAVKENEMRSKAVTTKVVKEKYDEMDREGQGHASRMPRSETEILEDLLTNITDAQISTFSSFTPFTSFCSDSTTRSDNRHSENRHHGSENTRMVTQPWRQKRLSTDSLVDRWEEELRQKAASLLHSCRTSISEQVMDHSIKTTSYKTGHHHRISNTHDA